MTSKLITEGLWSGHPMGPPTVVHCSAGIGRTGTFMTIDTAIRKFEDVGKVDIRFGYMLYIFLQFYITHKYTFIGRAKYNSIRFY